MPETQPKNTGRNTLIHHEIDGLKEVIFTRLNAMDEAVKLFQENLVRVPTDVDKQVGQLREVIVTRLDALDEVISLIRAEAADIPNKTDDLVKHLRELCEEKFESIAIQFNERDIRTEQTSKDAKVAVEAALQAAKEAVGEQNKSSALAIAKSEASTNKQIDQIGAMINSSTIATNDKIDDIKERLIAIEGRSKGAGDSWGIITGGIGIVVAIVAVIVSVIIRH